MFGSRCYYNTKNRIRRLSQVTSYRLTDTYSHLIIYREIKWLVEIPRQTLTKLNDSQCSISIRLDVPKGMYINPDELAEIIRTSDVR